MKALGRRETSLVLATVAGILLILSNAAGATRLWDTAIKFVSYHLQGYWYFSGILLIVLFVLSFLASLGGITVIGGGFSIYKNHVRTGKFLIGIGAGVGTIGLLITMIHSALQGWTALLSLFFFITHTIGGIGIVVSFLARMIAK